MDSPCGLQRSLGSGPQVEFTGLRTGRSAQGGGWGGFFVFFVIPIVLAVLLTTWAERRVQRMWLADQQQRLSGGSGGALPGEGLAGDGPEVQPLGEDRGGDLAQQMRAEYQSMRSREVQVLQELIRLGPAESWNCDPVQKEQVLEMLQRISPDVYRQWQTHVRPGDSDADRAGSHQ